MTDLEAYISGSLTILSNSCSQLGSWHLNSSTFTRICVFPDELLRSGMSSDSYLDCTSVAVPPHLGQTSIMVVSVKSPKAITSLTNNSSDTQGNEAHFNRQSTYVFRYISARHSCDEVWSTG